MATAETGEVNSILPRECFLRGVNRWGPSTEQRVWGCRAKCRRGQLPVDVSPLGEPLRAGRQGLVEGAVMLSRGVVNVACGVGRCLHVM